MDIRYAAAMTTPTTARSLTEGVYTCLRADILARRFSPGQRLRPSELGATRGVSLNVVREALNRLAGERSCGPHLSWDSPSSR
jgi:DNA-binding GntR family transcriptional regulator